MLEKLKHTIKTKNIDIIETKQFSPEKSLTNNKSQFISFNCAGTEFRDSFKYPKQTSLLFQKFIKKYEPEYAVFQDIPNDINIIKKLQYLGYYGIFLPFSFRTATGNIVGNLTISKYPIKPETITTTASFPVDHSREEMDIFYPILVAKTNNKVIINMYQSAFATRLERINSIKAIVSNYKNNKVIFAGDFNTYGVDSHFQLNKSPYTNLLEEFANTKARVNTLKRLSNIDNTNITYLNTKNIEESFEVISICHKNNLTLVSPIASTVNVTYNKFPHLLQEGEDKDQLIPYVLDMCFVSNNFLDYDRCEIGSNPLNIKDHLPLVFK